MIDKHLATGRDVIFSGAVWSWSGHFPENYYTRIASEAALAECKKRGLREVFGWAVHDMRYSMLSARIQTAIVRLESYLNGEIDALPELAENRLPIRGSAFRNYLDMALATQFAK